ncbi:MAG TPA: peptidase S8 [Clostridiales bacterium]|nr:peptidase S8 [Clostridiales bacterium]
MINKIDNNLYNIVKSLDNQNDSVECLVYANNYLYAKNYLNGLYKEVYEYPFISAFGIKTNLNNITKIAGLRQVKYISSVAKVFTQMDIAKKVHNFDNDIAKLTGRGVNVAIIDTGIAEHLDFCSFKNRILHFEDFVNHKKAPYDDNGHGTFVAGVLAGNGFVSGKKFSGIAPAVNIIMCKALDEKGETGSLTILKAMQWIYENKQKYNIKVVCMSLGSQPLESGDPLMQGAEALWNAGIVVVAAAGNSGPEYRTIKSPGASARIITVGALDDGRNRTQSSSAKSNYTVAKFSSRGPSHNFYKPDCLASGVDIVCTSIGDDIYTKMSGTSVSTPIVAGSCALLLEKNPNLTPIQVKSKILNSCDLINGDRNAEGFGVLNLKKLLS